MATYVERSGRINGSNANSLNADQSKYPTVSWTTVVELGAALHGSMLYMASTAVRNHSRITCGGHTIQRTWKGHHGVVDTNITKCVSLRTYSYSSLMIEELLQQGYSFKEVEIESILISLIQLCIQFAASPI